MDKIEISGRTLEEAVQLAAQELKVSTDAVEYEVVEEGTKGFLGLGQTPTTIKAWAGEGAEAAARPAVAPVEEPAAEEDVEEVEEVEEVKEEAEEAVAVAPKAAPAERAYVAPKAEAPGLEEEEGEGFVDAVLGTVAEILNPMGLDAKPALRSSTPEEIVIDLVGSDVAILIGRRGQTLDALQYLVGIIATRRVHSKRRIILDAERYREHHQEMLEQKAREYARAVKEEGKEAVLEPQPARDRRIIHVALADDPEVYTYSEGEGEDRHVVISPRK